MQVQAALDLIDNTQAQRLERLSQSVAIPSISTDPAYHQDCVNAANWFADQLSGIGFDSKIIDVPNRGKPYVFAESISDPKQPTVLFYGHYDVQPVDPLELWERDPFETFEKDGTIVGRGTADDKGQVLTFIEACRAIYETDGSFPLNIKVILEGEEESGSPSLEGFLAEHGDMLKADVALICDTGMYDETTPAITTRLRGLVGQEFTIQGPSHDLHSGGFGGAARNPIRVASQILADLHDDDGRIQVPGFYDGIVEPSDETKAQWKSLDFSGEDFLSAVGLSIPAGEKGFSVLEQVWSRPTCDTNGVVGGYTGEGFKTVLPSKASAKVSFRLVSGQNPARIVANFQQFVKERLPADCSVEFIDHGASPAMVVSEKLPQLKAAQKALAEEWGKAAVLMGCGGSIPIAEVFQRDLGIDSLLIGFGLDDDRIHSPNEKYNLSSFNGGTRSWVRVLAALAD